MTGQLFQLVIPTNVRRGPRSRTHEIGAYSARVRAPMCNTLFGEYLASIVRPFVYFIYIGAPTRAFEHSTGFLGYTVQASEMRRILCNVHSKESNQYVSAAVLWYQNLTIHTTRAIITCASLLTLNVVQTVSKRERSNSACMCKAGQGVGENSGRGGTGPPSNTWRRQASDGDADRRARQQA